MVTTKLRAHKNDFIRHKDSEKHKKNSAAITFHPSINQVFPTVDPVNKKKLGTKFELQLAVHVACHSSIRHNLNLQQCFAIATDGGSNLCGCNKSLYTLMKKKRDDLMLFKCICHSIHLVCSHASEELPSALRRKKYLDIYNTINDGTDPLQMVHLSTTRWLARGQAIERILDQWDTLKLNFDFAATEPHQDRYVAKELQQMYNDPANLLYFTFLSPLLSEFNSINLLFQKEHADHFSILQELERFTLSLLRRVLHPSSVSLEVDLNFQSIYLPLQKVDFGYKFTALVNRLVKDTDISQTTVNNVKHRCQLFLIRACKELLSHTSGNTAILKKIRVFSPKICLKSDRPAFAELPLNLLKKGVDINAAESQWRKLLDFDFESIFDESIMAQGPMFWSKVIKLTDSEGNYIFKDIASLALTAYSLPVSNASVERVFSRVTLTKTKLRNRMTLLLLSAILRIKMHLEENGICCTKFEPTGDMLNFNSTIYDKKKTDTSEEDENVEELLKNLNF
ncbi:Protein of unknown function [Cotesia congregata]|uniref:HAT C-terminal dimerisation domain-containing protein n=1 Tax=Cotesia congregata TaxID=51543 RepID=A0A8J2MVL6_COTCN|nr:Protein of unknown function [Cotesia congregata]